MMKVLDPILFYLTTLKMSQVFWTPLYIYKTTELEMLLYLFRSISYIMNAKWIEMDFSGSYTSCYIWGGG